MLEPWRTAASIQPFPKEEDVRHWLTPLGGWRVRIDRPDSADGPEDARAARRARQAPDEPDATGKGKDGGTTVSGDGPSHSSPASSDAALRTERFEAHRAKADAVYRQYAIDHGHARVEKLECETVTPGTRRIEAEDPKPHPVGLNDRSKGRDRLAEPGHLTKDETRQASVDATTADSGMRDPTIPGDRSREYDLVPRTPVAVHDCDLPEGYKSSPALKRDPYHPDAVSERSRANQELYAATSRDRAAALGYDTRIPAQKAPFDSHGQEVFTNGKSYVTPDVDGHNVTNGWKMFSRRGARIGTYDSELNYVKE